MASTRKENPMADQKHHSGSMRRWRSYETNLMLAMAIAATLILAATQPALGQQYQYQKLYDFTGGSDGANPTAGLVMDSTGKLYGITNAGGTGSIGVVFRLIQDGSAWIFAPLYEFAGSGDGQGSRTRILVAPNSGLYGATISGGTGTCTFYNYNGCGTVFDLKPGASACKTAPCHWNETQIYAFPGGSDGGLPYGDLTSDASGNLYSSVYRGGNGCDGGLIYELVKGRPWTETVLYSFLCGNDGQTPQGGVVFDRSGNLYGPTVFGGQYGFGVIFKLTPSDPEWTESVIYPFQGGDDGGYPEGGLVFDNSGNIYGTTSEYGADGGGTVFELSPSGSGWNFRTLCSLSGSGFNVGPQASLVLDATTGNLYGTTKLGGRYGQGSVFQATFSGGACTTLYSFTGGSDGGSPWDGLALDGNGNLYGTTNLGGNNGLGVVFELTP